MRSIATLAISLIVGLSLATPPARVGAQQSTPIDSTVPIDTLCLFPADLHVTGQQSILLLPQDARIITYTRTATVTHRTSEVSATVNASGSERESTLTNGNIQTVFSGRNLFAISAEDLAKWGGSVSVPGLYLISGQVTKIFDYATGTDVYDPPADAQLINLCELID
jgi:hypothetical protein